MTKHQLFVLISTFIVGLMAGAYVYVTGFAPQYSNNEPDELDTSLTIIGEQIGGCQLMGVCASFSLESDRTYRYLPAYFIDAPEPELVEGRVSRGTLNAVREAIETTNFQTLQTTTPDCQAASDGIDYTYEITYEGRIYKLNSCGTAFYGSRLYNQLLLVWGEMVRAESGGGNVEREPRGAAGILIDRFGE